MRVCGGDGFDFGVANKHCLKHSVVFFFLFFSILLFCTRFEVVVAVSCC